MEQTCYEYSDEKNQWLIRERGISFEAVIAAMGNGQLLDIIKSNQKRYIHQKMYVVLMNDYVYLVPFINKDKNTVFLKTIFPSRKAKKHYLSEQR